MLVALGEFLRQRGLLEQLRQIPIPQKTHTFTPQAKVLEFLIGIMSGIEYLQDLNYGPQPLVPDQVVAQAWGLKGFAHFTTVGRTLEVCDAKTVQAVETAIDVFSRPYIDAAVHAEIRQGRRVVFDLDLTGRSVSSTSTTYPAAAFGGMNDQVRLGYQLARVCLSPQTGERLWLAGLHHPGNSVSTGCLQELIQVAEAQTGIRPRRRPELVDQRLTAQAAEMARTQPLLGKHQAKVRAVEQQQTAVIGQQYHAAQERKGHISPEKHQHLCMQLKRWQKRQPRLGAQKAQAQRLVAVYQMQLAQQVTDRAALQAWQTQLASENVSNPNAPTIEARMDAGFVSGNNVAWLLEMGYAPNTKSPNARTTAALCAHLPRGTAWTRVGANAEMVLIGTHDLRGCPYPLTVALERFKVQGRFKYACLVRYGAPPPLAQWFAAYNGRQTIEAGNKEMKGPFFVQHFMSRSPAGMQLQVVLTGLAANAIRWCRPWLQECAAAPTARVNRILGSLKAIVRVAANSTALVQRNALGISIVFSPQSALPEAAFTLHNVPAVQLPLGFHRPFQIESESTNLALNAHSLR